MKVKGFCFHQLLVCPIRNKEDLHKGADQAIKKKIYCIYLYQSKDPGPPPPPKED